MIYDHCKEVTVSIIYIVIAAPNEDYFIQEAIEFCAHLLTGRHDGQSNHSTPMMLTVHMRTQVTRANAHDNNMTTSIMITRLSPWQKTEIS